MENTNDTKEKDTLIYELHWKTFLVNMAFDILGDGFYTVHPRNCTVKGHLKPRTCFGIIHGYSANGFISREQLSRLRKEMSSEDLDKSEVAIAKCFTYLMECAERVYPSTPPWWDISNDEPQFFRENDGGLSDKYWLLDCFFRSIGHMGYNAPLDEYGWPKARAFDRMEIERELPRLLGKYFHLSFGYGIGDCCEKEEWRIAASKRLGEYIPIKPDTQPFGYDDGRYSLAAQRVFENWELDSKKSFFAWPIKSFEKKLEDIDGEKELYNIILKKLFGGKDDSDGVKNIEDLITPRKLHPRKWKTFERCFRYYSRALPGDDYPCTFGKELLDEKMISCFSDEQIDEAVLAFLVFQSEMMAAFVLNNTMHFMYKNLSQEAVESVLSVWRENWAVKK